MSILNIPVFGILKSALKRTFSGRLFAARAKTTGKQMVFAPVRLDRNQPAAHPGEHTFPPRKVPQSRPTHSPPTHGLGNAGAWGSHIGESRLSEFRKRTADESIWYASTRMSLEPPWETHFGGTNAPWQVPPQPSVGVPWGRRRHPVSPDFHENSGHTLVDPVAGGTHGETSKSPLGALGWSNV